MSDGREAYYAASRLSRAVTMIAERLEESAIAVTRAHCTRQVRQGSIGVQLAPETPYAR